jgi:uncharacterized membrane protein YgcG
MFAKFVRGRRTVGGNQFFVFCQPAMRTWAAALKYHILGQLMTNALQSPPLPVRSGLGLSARWLWLPLIFGLWMGPSAHAVAPEVKDGAGFFSATAIEKANREIGEIDRRFHRDLMIETFPSVPADKVEQVKQMDAKARTQFYHTWSLERARKEEVNGIYVLITKVPPHIQALVGNETQRRAFTLTDRNRLADGLTAAFKRKDYDGGLLEAVGLVQKTMAENLGAKTKPGGIIPAPLAHPEINRNAPLGGAGGMSWMIWLIVIVIGVWILMALLRGIGRAIGGGGGGMGYAGLRIRTGRRRRRRRLYEWDARRAVRRGGRELAL